MLHSRLFFHSLFVTVLILFMFSETASGITVSATPATSPAGQAVAFAVQSNYTIGNIAINCDMQITFGDTPAWFTLSPACTTMSCTNRTSHVYNTPGTYRVTVRDGGGTGCDRILPPTTASTIVTITPPAPPHDITLSDGVVGMEYAYVFGAVQHRYRLAGGRLPPGLKPVRNKLTGIPELEGRYRFQIRATTPAGATDTWYNLRITKAKLTVTTTPQKVELSRNRAGSFRLNYTFSSSEKINDTLTSTKGLFFAGSTQLASINTRLSTNLINGSGRLTEQVNMPLAVIKKAQRLGVDKIRYQRTFSTRYMDTATTSSVAIAMGTGFSITNMRIYFSDERSSKKFVKRNEKNIAAEVELRYEGAGLLKGYWQVDNRTLARVTKNLSFANSRTLHLQLPKIPPLPTHATGSHRLRFVITEPAMNIAFPQAIYIVTGEDLSVAHPIILLSPADGAEIPATEMSFSWKNRPGVPMYRIDFFQGDNKEPIFSAFSKTSRYSVPSALLAKKFSSEGEFSWRVTGLDRSNTPNAQSKRSSFSLIPDSTSVPGRLLLLINKTADKKDTLLNEILQSGHQLSISERITLTTLGSELIILATEGDIHTIKDQLQAAYKEILIQPDYFYFTHGAIVEGRNREDLFSFLQFHPPGTGKDVRVAIIDTGVDLHHYDLAPNLLNHANYIKDSSYQGEIHGTAVAGIIAAAENHQGMAGIAPQASILALRSCEQIRPDKAKGRCYSSSLLQAIDSAMANKATIINMSLGAQVPDMMFGKALTLAAAQNILLIAPAGNNPRNNYVSFPASHPDVISVAGQTESGTKLPNQKVARQADMILPVEYLQVTRPQNKVGFMSGTSMASAAAAGLLANLNPDMEQINTCRTTESFITCLGKTK